MSRGGDLIHEARRRAGLSQAELARRLGTSQPAVARWEKGRAQPAMDRVVEALRACGLDLMVRVVPRDEHDLTLAHGNLRLSPNERLAQVGDMADFAVRARRAERRGRADRVSDHADTYTPERGPVFRPDAILAVLASCDVEYILIGGLAAVFHGSPQFTRDVDVCPRRTQRNLARLASALAELDARLRTEAASAGVPFPRDARFLRGVEILNTTTRAGDLVVTYEPAGTAGYDDLRRDAQSMDLDGVAVTVASLADVIRSKEAAGRPKDQAALHVLRELLRAQASGD